MKIHYPDLKLPAVPPPPPEATEVESDDGASYLRIAPNGHTIAIHIQSAYLVLGEVIEKKTGLTYENYVKQYILAPLGIYDIRLGKNLLAEKQEREGEYITPPQNTTLSAYGTGLFVPWQYGGWSLEAMDAHGGWIASARA